MIDPPIVVDRNKCEQLARLMTDLRFPSELLDRPPGIQTSNNVDNFYLMLVAICHQTQSLRGRIDGRLVRGWDYLQRRLYDRTRLDEKLLKPQEWAAFDADAVRSIYHDDTEGDTLTALPERAGLIRDLGRIMVRNGWNGLRDLFGLSGGQIAAGELNLVDLLSRFAAYQDPVRKKTYLLLGLMRDAVGWEFADPENLGPPVDYHEIRGHLRIGTVRVRDEALHKKLVNRHKVSQGEEDAIRSAVFEAIVYVSRCPGVPDAMTIHYLFWNVFRSVCLREDPLCKSKAAINTLPEQLLPVLVDAGYHDGCPFNGLCRSRDAVHRFWECQVSTDWY